MGETSEAFECKTGLRQADALSPIIFNLALEQVIRDMHEKREMTLVGMNTILAYAENLVILVSSIHEIKTSAEKLFKEGQNMDLKVYEEKTK